MYRIDTSTNTGSLPTPAAAGTPGYFQLGGSGANGTQVSGDWLNAVQEEPISVMAAAGITPAKLSGSSLIVNHLLTAIQRLCGVNFGASTTTATLSLDQCGTLIVDANGGSITLTLPTSATGFRTRVRRVDVASSNTVSIVTSGSDSIAPWITTQPTSLSLGCGETVLLEPDRGTFWYATRSRPSDYFSLTGSGSITVPAGYSGLEVEAVGGGGGAGGDNGTDSAAGGGAGGTARGTTHIAPAGTVFTYAQGGGGAGGAAGNAGSDGTASTISGSGLSLTANPGSGGGFGAAPAGGEGGTASGGDDNLQGGPGGDGYASGDATGGNGGASSLGGGGRAATVAGGVQNGHAPGSGGGAGYHASIAGGNGAAGRIRGRYLQ